MFLFFVLFCLQFLCECELRISCLKEAIEKLRIKHFSSQKTTVSSTFPIRLRFLRVLLQLGHCHLCLKGHLKLPFYSSLIVEKLTVFRTYKNVERTFVCRNFLCNLQAFICITDSNNQKPLE